MKVHGIHDDADGKGSPSGCGFYRIILPLNELGKHGWDVSWRHGIPRSMDPPPPVIIGQRIDRAEALGTWRRLRGRSKLIFEIDDDVWNIPRANWQAYRTYQWEHHRDAVETAAATANVVTVTTEPLAQILRKFNPDVRVIPNFIPGELLSWQRPEPQTVTRGRRERRRVVVGWRGGSSHALDVHAVARPVRHVLERHKDARLHIVGTDFRPTFGVGADFTDWVPIDLSLAYFRSLLPFDIGLAPLSGLEFDRSKSNIAALELAALGIPVIASDSEPYRDFVIDGVTGYLIRKRSDWARRLDELICDHEARETMGAAARAQAARWTIESGYQQWADLFEELGA